MSRDFDAFISYTRQQGTAVAKRVINLLQGENFRIWQDCSHMRGGDDFWRQIEEAIERARYLVMVLTPDAFTDDRTVLRNEWLTARRRGCRILPVFEAGAIDFNDLCTPAWLRKLDCYDLDNQNQCIKLISDLHITPDERRVPHNVEFPRDFVRREREMREIVEALLSEKTGRRVSLTTAFRGAGGFGKTTLAKAICHEDEVLACYTDGVLWITIGEGHRGTEELLTGLLEQLGLKPASSDNDFLFGEWKEALRTRQCLVVLDDVWNDSDVFSLIVAETKSAFLITTRIPRVALAADAYECLVDQMNSEQACGLLAASFNVTPLILARLNQLAEKAGSWPLLLGLIAAQLQLRLRRPGATPEAAISQTEEDLRELSLTAFDRPDPKRRSAAVATTIEASLRYLTEYSPANAERYKELSIFPDDIPIPVDILQDLWTTNRSDAWRTAESFDDAGLAILDQQRGLILHDVFIEYLRSKISPDELTRLNQRLLAAWPNIYQLPNEYAWRWFGWHCVHAGEISRLESALLDLKWVGQRLEKTGLVALLADCQQIQNSGSSNMYAIALLREVLEKSAHVLLVAPEQLPAQIFGRTRNTLAESSNTLLWQAVCQLDQRALQPISHSFHPVGSALRRTLRGHENWVNGALELPDNRLLSWGADGVVRLWSASGEILATLHGHEGPINGLLRLSNGKLLSWSADATLRLWSNTGELLEVLLGHEGPISGALELVDGRLLSWSADATLRLWSAGGELIFTLRGHEASVSGAVSLFDDRLLSWSRDRTIRLWSSIGEPLAVAKGHEASVLGARQLADRRLLSWAYDRSPILWSSSGDFLAALHGHSERVNGALALADGRILTWAQDGTLRIWSSDNSETVAVLKEHEGPVTGALELANGRLLSWSKDRTLRLWSGIGAQLAVLRGHIDSIVGALALADGQILSWSNDKMLRLWSKDGEPVSVLGGHEDRVDGAIVLSDDRLLSWSADGTIRLWSVTNEPLNFLYGHDDRVYGALVLATNRLLSWSRDKSLRQWTFDLEPIAEMLGHDASVSGATLLSDGMVASWAKENTLRLWSCDGALIALLRGHEGPVAGALLLADKRLLSWSKDKTLRLWSSSGEPLNVLRGHEWPVSGAIELADGRLLSWSPDRTLRLWSCNGTPLATLLGHKGPVNGAFALANGEILSIAADGSLGLWASSGEPRATLIGHDGPVYGALELTNGRLLSWSKDRTLRLWTKTGEPLTKMSAHDSSVAGAKELSDGRILSWSFGSMMRLWTNVGEFLGDLVGHEGSVNGVQELPDGRILSWSSDRTLRLWSSDGAPLDRLFFDAEITVVLDLMKLRYFVGDALGGIHIIAVSKLNTFKKEPTP